MELLHQICVILDTLHLIPFHSILSTSHAPYTIHAYNSDSVVSSAGMAWHGMAWFGLVWFSYLTPTSLEFPVYSAFRGNSDNFGIGSFSSNFLHSPLLLSVVHHTVPTTANDQHQL